MFADARGHPGHIAAVLFHHGQICYTDMAVPAELLAVFKKRADNQIMGLEMLSVCLGMCSFASVIRDRRIVIWSDNTGAEAACQKGTAKSWDHAQVCAVER